MRWSRIVLVVLMVIDVWYRAHTFGPDIRAATGVNLWPQTIGDGEPLDCDEAAYAYMGHRVLRGDALYRDLTEYKPPLGYWIYTMAVAVGGYSELAIRVMAIPFVLATIAAVWWIAMRLGGPVAAALAAGLYVLLSTDPFLFGNGSNMEHFINLFATLSLAMLIRARDRGDLRWIFAAGVCLGAAALVKQVALAYAIVFVPALFARAWTEDAGTTRRVGARSDGRPGILPGGLGHRGGRVDDRRRPRRGPGRVRGHRLAGEGAGDRHAPRSDRPVAGHPMADGQRRSQGGAALAVRLDRLSRLVGDRELAGLAGLGAGPDVPRLRRGERRTPTPGRWLDGRRLAPGRVARPLLAALLPAAHPRRGDRGRGRPGRCDRRPSKTAVRGTPAPFPRRRRDGPADPRHRRDGHPPGALLPGRPARRADGPVQGRPAMDRPARDGSRPCATRGEPGRYAPLRLGLAEPVVLLLEARQSHSPLLRGQPPTRPGRTRPSVDRSARRGDHRHAPEAATRADPHRLLAVPGASVLPVGPVSPLATGARPVDPPRCLRPIRDGASSTTDR